MRRFHVVVNGLSYEVEVEEIGSEGEPPAATPASASAPSEPAAREVKAAPAPAAPSATAAKAPARHAQPARSQSAAPAASVGTPVTAPLPGAVLEIKVAVGDEVREGDVVAILEAMKMENEILAPCSGHVAAVRVTAGSAVDGGDVLLEIA